jgi:tRNA-dihydrouridine synthase
MVHGVLVVLVAASLAACATTTFSSSWKAPDAQPMGSLAGQKVVAVAVTKNQAMRRSAEDALVGVLNARGAQGIASYSIIGDDAVQDEAKAKAAIEKAGAVAVVVMRPVAQEKEVSATSSMYMGPRYGGYWGGYYGYGWGGAYGGGVDIRTDTIVTVETLVYSLKQNKLIWAGQSKTTNPSKVDAFVKEVAAGAGKEMKKAGLL